MKQLRSLNRYTTFWVAAFVIGLVFDVALIVVWQWDWLAQGETNSAVLRNVGLIIAAAIALPLAVWRSWVAGCQADTAERGLQSERYQRAAEMLGNESLAVRLGGIYALSRLAGEHQQQYHLQIMRLFCAFVRNPTKGDDGEVDSSLPRVLAGHHFPMVREDIQAVLDAIRGRGRSRISLERTAQFRLFLNHANLRGAILADADLRGAFMQDTDLSGAFMFNTRLDAAVLINAKISGTLFSNLGEEPATGLSSYQLEFARADPDEPPLLDGVKDVTTGTQLVWRGGINEFPNSEERPPLSSP